MQLSGLSVVLSILCAVVWFRGIQGQVPTVTDTGETPLGHSMTLDPDNKYRLSWGFDPTHLTFQVEVETLGYVGLGISPNGGMPGSDIFVGWVDDNTGAAYIQDRMAEGYFEPRLVEPQLSQLHWAYQNATHTVLRFSRLLDLCAIQRGTVRLIWSYRNEDPVSETSLQYHGPNRGTKSVFLLDIVKSKPKLPENTFTFDVRNRQVTMAAEETWYWCESFSLPQIDRKHHVVKIEPIVENLAEVHHMVLYACYHPVQNESVNVGAPCFSFSKPTDWWTCYGVLYGWGVGGETMHFPDHVGLPLGYEGGPTLLILETHFDNQRRKKDLVDSSGLRLTLSPELRQHDAGSICVGTSVLGNLVIPPHSEDFKVKGHCLAECIEQSMGNQVDEINIFATFMHTHLAGRKVSLRQFRYGIEQEVVSEDQTYDFNLQQTRFLPNERVAKKGDSLLAECSYSTLDRTNMTRSGYGTREEMCVVFVLYYPKIDLSTCYTEPFPQHLMEFMGVTLDRKNIVETPEEFKGRFWLDVLQSEVDWNNSTTRQEFNKWMNKRGVTSSRATCADGIKHYPVNSKSVAIPRVLYEIPADSPPQLCPFVYHNSGRRFSISSLHVIAFWGIFALTVFR